ncbi:Ribokinase-like protein [Russula brevipes]|nr:Ribokinase-like protein [Russula brevipes]
MYHQAPRCLVRGSLNIDEFFYVDDVVRPGQTISSVKFERRAGGKGANQAAAIARAGGVVSLVGAVGGDGAWLVRDLEGYGVSTADISVVQEVTGRAIIQITPEGENCIILHKGANFALSDPSAQSDVERHLAGISHLLLQNEIPWASTLAYLNYAYARGLTTVFNPSPMPADTQLRAFPWLALSWLIVNEGEADGLLHAIRGNPDGPEHFASTSVVCTLGAAGVLASLCGQREMLYVPAVALEGNVRDTTGAGDCFTGYFVTGLMQTGNKQLSKDEAFELLRFSAQAAGMCVEKSGAMESIPERVGVEARAMSNT